MATSGAAAHCFRSARNNTAVALHVIQSLAQQYLSQHSLFSCALLLTTTGCKLQGDRRIHQTALLHRCSTHSLQAAAVTEAMTGAVAAYLAALLTSTACGEQHRIHMHAVRNCQTLMGSDNAHHVLCDASYCTLLQLRSVCWLCCKAETFTGSNGFGVSHLRASFVLPRDLTMLDPAIESERSPLLINTNNAQRSWGHAAEKRSGRRKVPLSLSEPDLLKEGSASNLDPLSLGSHEGSSPSAKAARQLRLRLCCCTGGWASLSSYRTLYICACSTAFANAMTFSVLGPFLPSYAEEKFGSTPAEIGMIMAAYPLFNLLTSPCVGIIMNKVGECTKRGSSSQLRTADSMPTA
eukprot:8165-Heterococcus_DN1.PRE.2